MVAISPILRFFCAMSDKPNPVEPLRESIAPRHESLAKEFHGDIGPRRLEYGEARLWLVAKGPHSLFAYWEFLPAEHPEAAGTDGRKRFFIRIIDSQGETEAQPEILPHEGNIEIPVLHADSGYTAELGFICPGGTWCFIAKSGITHTPPRESGNGGTVVYAKIPANIPLKALRRAASSRSPARALARAQRLPHWTPEQEQMFIRLLAADVAEGGKPEGRAARARARMMSEPAAQALKEIPESLWAQLDSAGTSSPGEAFSSRVAAQAEIDLPLHVNAELIFYGGTASGNLVTVAGDSVHLRHDGTFRVHVLLPDGEFEIPIVARSADGTRMRKAVLRFSRETEADAGTGATPQPDYLPPSPPGAVPPA